MTKRTWKEIATAAESAPFNLGLFQFTMSAEENAAETIHIEKARPIEDFDIIALATLQEILSYSDDNAAKEFFAALGVEW